MRSPLAALVAACFAVAVSMPEVGLVVHRHADGEVPHVHPGLEADAPHHHDDEDDDHHHAADDADGGPGLHAMHGGSSWHSHATSPFHRAAPPSRTIVAHPRPIALLTPTRPLARAAGRIIPGRSRAPPVHPPLRPHA